MKFSGHRSTFSPLDLKTSDHGFAPYLRESMKSDRPILLTTEDGTLSRDLIDGLQWRGFGDPCRAAVVCPLHATTGESILGFLIMGVNPRRPYDDDYSLFIQLINRQLATSMASVVLFEEEIRRGQKAARLAALDVSARLHVFYFFIWRLGGLNVSDSQEHRHQDYLSRPTRFGNADF